MSAPATKTATLHLPDVETHPQPGVYRDLIESARARNVEYSKIWDLFAFQQSFTVHLARFTHGVLREPAAISPGFRELIAAYTSNQNECGFCTQAHAAAASELMGDSATVWAAAALRHAGWNDEAIYYAITTCALFNFYNRWITACGVPQMSPEAHREQGRTLAARGYSRD